MDRHAGPGHSAGDGRQPVLPPPRLARPAANRLAVLAWLGAACLGALAGPGLAPDRAEGAPTLVPVVQGLTEPVYVTHAGDGTNRLFVVEQAGLIKVLQPGSATPSVFLDLQAQNLVRSGGERGLLSVAFPPNYEASGRFYVYYTREPDGAIVIARHLVSMLDPNVADPTGTPILTIPHPVFGNHNGGQLQFGPDGCLYAGTGDGGGGGDPNGNAQDLGSLLGKLLRLDEDGAPCTSFRANPFGGGAERIWALGLRNPWRFSFDRQTADLYIADVGEDTREEVDLEPISSPGGANYCWSRLEGSLLFNAGVSCTTGIPIPPILEYGHTRGRCSITGGYAYRGAAGALPAGAYLFGDLCSGEIFLWQGGFASILFDTGLSIASFGEDEAGELYVVDHDGSLLRVQSTGGPELLLGVERLLPHGAGDTLRVGLGVRNPGPAFQADVYLGALLPDGSTAVFITGTSPLTGQALPLSADPRSFPPLLSGVTVGAGLSVPPGLILAHTFTSPGPPGPVVLFAALVVPGALADGRVDPGDVVAAAMQRFDVIP